MLSGLRRTASSAGSHLPRGSVAMLSSSLGEVDGQLALPDADALHPLARECLVPRLDRE